MSRTQTGNQLHIPPRACYSGQQAHYSRIPRILLPPPQALTSGSWGLGALWESGKTMEWTHIAHACKPHYRTLHSVWSNLETQEAKFPAQEELLTGMVGELHSFPLHSWAWGQDLDTTTDLLRSVMEAYSKIQFPKENSKDDSYVLGFVCTTFCGYPHPKNNSFRSYTMEMVSAGVSCVRIWGDLVAGSGGKKGVHSTLAE